MKLDRGLIKPLAVLLVIPSIAIVLVGCTLLHHAPVINELTADKDYLCIGATCGLNATVIYPYEDELTYTWVATSGEIKGEGSSVTWEAPPIPGDHNIRLIVIDGKGEKATRTLTINVIPNSSPIIKRLSSKLVVCRDIESTPVECVASDPDGDELSYRWTTTGGEISGQGPVISWIIPDKNGLYTVAVAITDGKGCEATREKTIRVT
jgi:hypothetical protein